jgi:transcriptional regulator with XRE-family HTH domain
MESYAEVLARLGARARALRITRELQLAEVAGRAGVGVATVHRFERTGRASIENVLRIATVLAARDAFEHLFELPPFRTMDEALASTARPERQRVRRKRRP